MNAQQRDKIVQFINTWTNRGNEKSETQIFWLTLLRDVLGIEHPEALIQFEKSVKKKNRGFIDAYIPSTHVLIEQKSADVDLSKKQKQSDGDFCTPYEQALRYNNALPYSLRNKWIVICNFQEFQLYDMDKPQDECLIIKLEDLEANVSNLSCIVDKTQTEIFKETELSIRAGELVGKLYDALLQEYDNPDDPETLKNLNKLCVRLVFCLYAEDADLFEKSQFYNFLKDTQPEDIGDELLHLFSVLNTPVESRNKSLKPKLKAFPYVNGGLFQEEDIEIPPFTEDIKYVLLHECSLEFDWSGISPTIFGAVFESTLNPETRRSNGMHYTSIENIHKLIDPLFLNELKDELKEIFMESVAKTRRSKLKVFHNKIAELTFFDPACGSGNFLTETYICLRKMENDIIKGLYGKHYRSLSHEFSEVKVSISNFYGIELNDFAVSVAKTALWIAESQMIRQTEMIVHTDIKYLPLTSYPHIVEGNALRIDWESVVPKERLNYIMGNPPYAGRRYRTVEQQKDLAQFFTYKDIDYVACWYYKAAQMIKGTSIKSAFVSTNSITQGEQVSPLWYPLSTEFNIQIDFAYRTFVWNSESTDMAHVHCVIIGFSSHEDTNHSALVKKIFIDENQCVNAKNINGYLLDAPNVFINIRTKPLCNVPSMKNGNVPLDGNALKIEAEDYPKFKGCPWVKKLMGGQELLHNEKRYVLWLVGVSPNAIKTNKLVRERVELCRKNRLAMKDKDTQKLALTPTTFRDTNNPENYIAMPMLSSENRSYIPMTYLHDDVIATNQIQTIPNAGLYEFGVLTSLVHMAWMRTVCGRLEMRYRYSKEIVYNNFPWTSPTEEQKAHIEQTAQAILDARALYPDCSLAVLYDSATMPPELLKAHQRNDQAVLKAYGFKKNISESDIVAKLMKMYQELTKK